MSAGKRRSNRRRVHRRATSTGALFALFAVSLAACSSGRPTAGANSLAGASTAPVGASAAAVNGSAIPVAPGETSVATRATPPPGGAAALDVCALLTSTELSRIFVGGAVEAKVMPSGGWVAGQCAWSGEGSGLFLSVGTKASILAFGDAASPNAKALLEGFKTSGATKAVPGIGGGAATSSLGLAAYKGDTYFQITNLGLSYDQLVAIAKVIASKF